MSMDGPQQNYHFYCHRDMRNMGFVTGPALILAVMLFLPTGARTSSGTGQTCTEVNRQPGAGASTLKALSSKDVDRIAEAMRRKIPKAASTYEASGRTYYISATWDDGNDGLHGGAHRGSLLL